LGEVEGETRERETDRMLRNIDTVQGSKRMRDPFETRGVASSPSE